MANQDVQALIDTITALLRESGDNVGNFEVTQSPEGEIRAEVWLEKPVTVDNSIKKQIAAPEKIAFSYEFNQEEFIACIKGRKPYPFIVYATNADWFTVKPPVDSPFYSDLIFYLSKNKNAFWTDGYALWRANEFLFDFYPKNHEEVHKVLSPIIAYALRENQ